MSFPLAVRSQHQLPDELYPSVWLRDSGLPVVLDDEDGAVRDLAASGLTIRTQIDGHVRDGMALRRSTDVLVTDRRVVLVGQRQSTDSILAGHIRLDWIVAVGGSHGRGVFRSDELRLVLQHDTGEYTVVTLAFDPEVDVHELAQDIARRTALRWLRQHDSCARSARWEAVAVAEKQTAKRGEFALTWMPTHTTVPSPALSGVPTAVPA